MSEKIDSVMVCEEVQASCEVSVRTRFNMSMHFFLAAKRFSQAVQKVESMHSGQEIGDFWEDILHNAVSCILCSIAGLEAYVNELYYDRDEIFAEGSYSVSSSDLLRDLWKDFDRKPLQDKFDFFLMVRGKSKFDRGQGTGSELAKLVSLRNALVHFRPEWDDQGEKHENLSKKLNYSFKMSPFISNEPAFPRSWATHGCTRWAIKTAASVIDEFEKALGLEARFDLAGS